MAQRGDLKKKRAYHEFIREREGGKKEKFERRMEREEREEIIGMGGIGKNKYAFGSIVA
ncbi:unnamed protein product [Sphenostylis stenocarpa]|uniref:Uncharacterized protein n=1 Tax=Sphenostylis stenocarpa TaxID=92480 RepID=A0AA86W2W7_9FABA|nr:unnamed protein product [Sphenostylis stenocarpa]